MGRRNQVAKSTQRYLKRTETAEWKTALYARLSSENNGLEDDRSLQNQIKYVEEYIEKHPDLSLTGRYVDNGQSGMNFEREQFKQMLDDVRDGKTNCIVVKDLSRFGRNHIEAGYYLEKVFPFMDVRFISINDNFDSMDESKKDGIMVPLKNMINEMYAKDIQRKVITTIRTKQKKGEALIQSAPYGYQIDPECHAHLIVDPDAADYVRLIFSLRAGGLGYTAIAERFNEMGIPTPIRYKQSQGKLLHRPGGELWTHKAVRRIIVNPVYIGTLESNHSGKGGVVVFPNAHEPLVDEETFRKVNKSAQEATQKQIAALEECAVRRQTYPNVLQGLFFCAHCGRSMLYDRRGNSQVVRNIKYRCSGYSRLRKDDPAAPPCATRFSCIPEQRVYKFVLDQIRRQLRAGLELEELERLMKTDAREKQKKLNGLKEQEDTIKQKLRRLYEDFADRIITEEEYREIRKNYTEKAARLKEQIEAVETGKGDADPWAELKKKIFTDEPGGETVGTIQLSETSSVEIVEDDEPDLVERLLRRGLTRELAETMVGRMEYSVDGRLSITFKCEDYVQKLVTRRLEMDMAEIVAGQPAE